MDTRDFYELSIQVYRGVGLDPGTVASQLGQAAEGTPCLCVSVS